MATARISMDTLPEELILAILDHIDDLQSLADLSITTRRLHRLTLPHLYRTFPGQNSELFLRTVSHHPYLAHHTKKAIWRRERKTNPRIDMLEKAHITNRLNQLCVPHGTDLASQFAKFGHNDDYWYFEVLLLFLPNLEVVDVKESWLWDDHHYWFKSLSPFFNPLCESRLTSASLDGPMRVENVVPLLTIATLKSLELTQVTVMRREGYRVFQWSVWPASKVLAARQSNLEVLTLRESYLDLHLLLPLFQGIRALTSFTYEHMPHELADEVSMANGVDGASLSACLALQSASLEHVRIRDLSTSTTVTTATLFQPFGPCAARKFEQLRTLDIGPFEPRCKSNGLGHTVNILVHGLPPALQTLRLMTDPVFASEDHSDEAQGDVWMENMTEFLYALANALASSSLSVDVVELLDWNPTLGWFPDKLPMLQKVYADLGLRLESICGTALDIYGAEPFCMDEDAEDGLWQGEEAGDGWVVITKLGMITKAQAIQLS